MELSTCDRARVDSEGPIRIHPSRLLSALMARMHWPRLPLVRLQRSYWPRRSNGRRMPHGPLLAHGSWKVNTECGWPSATGLTWPDR